MWGRTYINLPNFLLNFLLKYAFVLDVIWNITSLDVMRVVCSRSALKKLGCASFFQHTSRCLDMWWNTLPSVSYITSMFIDYLKDTSCFTAQEIKRTVNVNQDDSLTNLQIFILGSMSSFETILVLFISLKI